MNRYTFLFKTASGSHTLTVSSFSDNPYTAAYNAVKSQFAGNKDLKLEHITACRDMTNNCNVSIAQIAYHKCKQEKPQESVIDAIPFPLTLAWSNQHFICVKFSDGSRYAYGIAKDAIAPCTTTHKATDCQGNWIVTGAY